MKTLSRLLLCFLFLTAAKANAQETFAPLISENCVAFVHVDFTKVELDNVKSFLQKTGEDFLTQLGFDERSHRATARELAVELEKLDFLVRPYFDTVTKALGIRECAIIVDMSIVELGNGIGVVAFPWKNKTAEQRETLCSLVIALTDIPERAVKEGMFQVGDFLFLPMVDDSRIKATEGIVKGWLDKDTPVNSPIHEALQSVAGAEVKFAVAIPGQVRTMIQNAPLPPDMSLEVRNFLLFAAQRIDWASASVSLHNILGTEPPKNNDVLMTVKMASPSHARMLHGMLENLIEFGVNFAQFTMERESDNVPLIFQSPFVFQFAKGLLRTTLPDVEEDKLLFRQRSGGQVAVATAGMGFALLLPAVQAAREAARRMQCMNHMKQILLAIHNYHDTTNSLPPLYTVDANGKPLHSWRVLLLPYMEQTALYEAIRLDEPWDSPHNSQFHGMAPAVYRCPSSPQGGSSYSAIVGGSLVPNTKAHSSGEHTFARITDGMSNTLAIVEVNDSFNWMAPHGNITLEELAEGVNAPGNRVGSFHPGGMNVGLFDGSVRFINNNVSSEILRILGNPASGRAVPAF